MNLTDGIKQNPVASFIVLYLGLSFATLLLPVESEGAFVALLTLLTLVPTLVAVGLAIVMEGRRGVGALLRESLRWRSPLIWYVIAVAVGFTIQLGSSVVALAAGRIPIIEIASPTPFLFILIPFALLEEIGLRGFALRRLLDRHSPLAATLIVGIPWALVHVALIASHNPDGRSALVEGLSVLVVALPHTWIFVRGGRSVLVATALHWAYNTSGSLVGPARLISEAATIPFLLASTSVVAVALMLIDWRMWRAQPAANPTVETAPSIA